MGNVGDMTNVGNVRTASNFELESHNSVQENLDFYQFTKYLIISMNFSTVYVLVLHRNLIICIYNSKMPLIII